MRIGVAIAAVAAAWMGAKLARFRSGTGFCEECYEGADTMPPVDELLRVSYPNASNDASEFWRSLPTRAGVQRNVEFEQKVLSGGAEYSLSSWVPVVSEFNGAELTCLMMADALAIGGVRVCSSFRMAQNLAIALGYQMPTAHLVDLFNAQAMVWLDPFPQQPSWVEDGSNASTARMVQQSAYLDTRIESAIHQAGSGPMPDPLSIANIGKWWVLTNKFWQRQKNHLGMWYDDASCNHGWYRSRGRSPVQDRGMQHTLDMTDYSQQIRWVQREALMTWPDGSAQRVFLEDLIRDPEWAPIVTGEEGALPAAVHPAWLAETKV